MSDYKDLQVLGLSKLAAACYETLYRDGLATAGEIAGRLGKPKSSIYYALENLEKLGFVLHSNEMPWPQVTYFKAVRLDKALENLTIYQRRKVHTIVQEQIERSIRLQSGTLKPGRRDWR